MFFDRTKAVQYATQWALGRNPDFPNYSYNAGGDDCSNFISQVMLAGAGP
ncbi:MAG TPA: amidase domain-containing protein [Pyrinomonadaceae bacterium]|nr:amidase domain-containing protein [Pyrinomonadaceae bacterium]